MKKIVYLIGLGLITAFAGCKSDDPENPYANMTPPAPSYVPDADDLPEGSFAWLHAKIFKPTCANSGCHDGTFEPEFRTIASSYNSLVNQPVINNDETNSFSKRVVPFDANASWLHERLTVDVPNVSGIMPLESGDSDWDENSAFYIQKITEWINTGAKDMYGNPAPSDEINAAPIIYGVVVFPHDNTTTPYDRDPNSPYGIGSFMVPSDLVDVWILPYDDNALLTNFSGITIAASQNVTNFTGAPTSTFSLQSPITAFDFGGDSQQFYYKATLDLSGAEAGQTWYFRCYVDDGVQSPVTEIPNNASQPFWYLLFSLIVQ